MSLDEVDAGLFIGGMKEAKNGQLLERHGVSQVLSLRYSPLSASSRAESIRYDFIRMSDVENEDLIGSGMLQAALDIVSTALHDGRRVLVHWYGLMATAARLTGCSFSELGISRSATVCAAYLMAKYRLSVDDVLDGLRRVRAQVCPNAGFMEQLRLYERMDYQLKPSTHGLDYLAQLHQLPSVDIDFTSDSAVELASSEDAATDDAASFHCARCRQMLFISRHVIRHRKGGRVLPFHSAQRLHNPAPRDSGCATAAQLCSAIHGFLIVPMDWMDGLSELRGKVLCPRRGCGSKLGNFDWSGRPCAADDCRAFVEPFFSIHRDKVDRHPLTSDSATTTPPLSRDEAAAAQPS